MPLPNEPGLELLFRRRLLSLLFDAQRQAAQVRLAHIQLAWQAVWYTALGERLVCQVQNFEVSKLSPVERELFAGEPVRSPRALQKYSPQVNMILLLPCGRGLQ